MFVSLHISTVHVPHTPLLYIAGAFLFPTPFLILLNLQISNLNGTIPFPSLILK